MPFNLDPSAVIQFSLKIDRPLPEPQRPVFLLRHLASRKWREVGRLFDQAVKEVDVEKKHELLNQCIRVGLAGWEKMRAGETLLEYTPDNERKMLDEILTEAERWELADAVFEEPLIEEKEKKALSSPPPSTAAGSAAPAGEKSNAPTAPASPNP